MASKAVSGVVIGLGQAVGALGGALASGAVAVSDGSLSAGEGIGILAATIAGAAVGAGLAGKAMGHPFGTSVLVGLIGSAGGAMVRSVVPDNRPVDFAAGVGSAALAGHFIL